METLCSVSCNCGNKDLIIMWCYSLKMYFCKSLYRDFDTQMHSLDCAVLFQHRYYMLLTAYTKRSGVVRLFPAVSSSDTFIFTCSSPNITCMHVHFRMGSSKLALLLVFVACVERCLSASCVVDSFTVKEDFDPKRVRELKHTNKRAFC